jgi:hypothetical protein
VVVIPLAPREIAAVLLVPILIDPLVAPLPALTVTFPPVPPVPDSAPPIRLTTPPTPPVPDSVPAVRFNPPPVPAAALFAAGNNDREFPPVKVVISGERFPARAN